MVVRELGVGIGPSSMRKGLETQPDRVMGRKRGPKEETSVMYQDMTLSCVNCGGSFTFTADDQQFHASRGYQNPKRCPACRQQRRVEQRGGTGGYGAPRTMYDVTCANCGQPAQVPFLPRQERPVYCSNCFSKQRESAPSGY